ncbi:hypothetical protein EH228_17655 [Erwinia endophytica]|nr:hypothetical protein [Erwinia endophytica]KAB8306119.1 hypothetical protein EH228_17655 [Erwinia endophytica]
MVKYTPSITADIVSMREVCGPIPLKVILENCLLNKAQRIKIFEICRELQAAFVKTSGGFSAGIVIVQGSSASGEGY